VLLLPGISNSGPGHWQSLWQAREKGVARVDQRDWDHPVCDEWVNALDEAVREVGEPPILVAHSLGCLVAAHWAARASRAAHAILLFAVPDPSGPTFPRQAAGFSTVPSTMRAKRVTVVSSSDDPYSSTAYTLQRVADWNAEHIGLGPVGHINADSGLGDWPLGWKIVDRWRSE
jgi:predicted alpha/beta hydrolase family esterase